MEKIDRETKRRQTLSIGIYTTVQCLSLIAPYLMERIIDDYIPNGEFRQICIMIALFAAIPMVSIALQTLYNYDTIRFVRRKGNDYALRIMENLMYQELSFFDGEKSLELLSLAGKEIVGYLHFYVVELGKYHVSILCAIVTLLLMCRCHPLLGIAQVLYIPLAYYPVTYITRNVEQEVGEVVQKNAEMNQIKGDIFKAIDLIKLRRLESRKLAEVKACNAGINRIWGKLAALESLSGIWAEGFASILFHGLTFGISAILIVVGGGRFAVGQLVCLLSYCSLFYANINEILQTGVAKRKQSSEYAQALSYLKLAGEREQNKGKQAFSMKQKIEFRDCHFAYQDGTEILRGASLTIPAGQWTAIVGASGSGKSTLFDILMKLYTVSRDQVRIDGQDICDIDAFSIRENAIKITQQTFLFPGSIRDNLLLMKPDASEAEFKRVIDFACLTDYIASLPQGLDTDIGEAGKCMSGGEQQRLSIAMGMLCKGKLLLLDKVTASLNPEVEAELAEHFRTLLDEGYTIVSISHKESFHRYASRIYRIENGSALLQSGAVSDMI